MRQDTRMRGTARGISVRALGHSYGELRTLDGLDLEVARARRARPGRALRAAASRRCWSWSAGCASPSAGTIEVGGAGDAAERLARCAFMPQRDLLFPWLSALDNAALALRNRGAARGEARAAGRRAVRAASASPASRRARPAELSGGMRQRVAFLRTLLSEQAGAGPRRALRLARRDHPRRDAGVAGRAPCAPSRAPSILVTHDVEEALYLCDRVAVLSARPARIVEELAAPAPRAADRDAAVTDPALRRRPRAGDAGPARGSRDEARGSCRPSLLVALDRRSGRSPPAPARSPTSSTSNPSSSPRPPKSPARSGRTARCSPKTPG